ncbi:glycosyl transferase family 1 [Trinickia symbiotica]|uniref:Glycosyl transferase family 1 n=1 Tax=Trinickia symbiotica TaxID=863227 RepID=A0A2T3XVM8_9BURK|nr:glycosyltransferase family 4 protein [Trinickia symbiotica]PTB20579.1 glycosyl transferase family 1 [Trinickia symbiotica]
MRVLFVVCNLADYQIPRYRAMAQLAARRAHDVSLVEIFGRSRSNNYPQPARAKFFAEGRVNAVTLFKNQAHGDEHWLSIIGRLREVLRARSPDLVVTLGYQTSYSIYLCALRIFTQRFKLVYMSDSKADDGKRPWLKERLKKLLVSRFDGALVAGEKHRVYARSLGIPFARSRIGFDVIDVDYFRETAQRAKADAAYERTRFGLPERYAICVSRFVHRKNVLLVVDAFARSSLPHRDISLLLVGEGPLEEAVRERINALGLRERVVIISKMPNQEMPTLYALADFIILASTFDQWGLCIHEAMATGCPAIVTSTCGCAHELVYDSVNGFVVSPGDVDELIHAMSLLAEDHGLRGNFSLNAAKAVEEWTPSLFAENVLALADAVGAAP